MWQSGGGGQACRLVDRARLRAKRGAVVESLPAWRGPALPIHALMPPHRPSSAKARALFEHLRAFMR